MSIRENLVQKSVLNTISLLSINIKKLLDELNRLMISLGNQLLQFLLFEFGEGFLKQMEPLKLLGLILLWSSKDLKNLENLVDLRIPHNKGLHQKQLCHDQPNRPGVNPQTVILQSKKDLGSPVPESLHLMSESLVRNR